MKKLKKQNKAVTINPAELTIKQIITIKKIIVNLPSQIFLAQLFGTEWWPDEAYNSHFKFGALCRGSMPSHTHCRSEV
jgi:hypothetical protein